MSKRVVGPLVFLLIFLIHRVLLLSEVDEGLSRWNVHLVDVCTSQRECVSGGRLGSRLRAQQIAVVLERSACGRVIGWTRV
jgi:hypothetical protein